MIRYSVIIPCFNEAHVLRQSLESLRSAIGERQDIELLLIDNGSTDQSIEIAKSYGAQVHQFPDLKIAALRNQGAELSKGEYLLFLDADVQVPINWLERIDGYVEKHSADVVGFVDHVPPSAPWYARIWGLRALARRQTLRRIDSLPGRNLFVSRIWFDKVSGFSESLLTGEDKDFVMRLSKAGAIVISDPELDMIHLGFERNFKEWCRKEYWRQHSHIALMEQQGTSLRLLRFPLIATGHLMWLVIVMMCLVTGQAMIFALVAWFLPALVMSLANPLSRAPLLILLQFTLLYWLRFHIAGYSIIREFHERLSR